MGVLSDVANVYVSDNDGQTFYPSNLGASRADKMVFSLAANEYTVFAASPSAGKIFRSLDKGITWQEVFPQSTTGVLDTPEKYFLFSVQPNPLRGNGHITYRVPKASHVRILLVNALGQTVEVLHDATQSEGEYSLPIESNRFGTGVYLVQLEAGASMVRYKIVIAR
jgi:hypothetical protein